MLNYQIEEIKVEFLKTVFLEPFQYEAVISADNGKNYLFLTKEKFLRGYKKIVQLDGIYGVILQIEKLQDIYQDHYLFLQLDKIALVKLGKDKTKFELVNSFNLVTEPHFEKKSYQNRASCMRLKPITKKLKKKNLEFEEITQIFTLSYGRINLYILLREPDQGIHLRIKRTYITENHLVWFDLFQHNYIVAKDLNDNFLLSYYDPLSTKNPESFQLEHLPSLLASKLISRPEENLIAEIFTNAIM